MDQPPQPQQPVDDPLKLVLGKKHFDNLMAIMALFKDREQSFAVFVEMPNATSECSYFSKDTTFPFLLGVYGFRSGGNVDILISTISKYARLNGHNSNVLSALGVPTTPAPATEPVLTEAPVPKPEG